MHFRISSQISRNVYQPNDTAATGIGSNRKALYLGYIPRAEDVPSLTQGYGPESLSQNMVEHCHETRSLYDVLGQEMASILLTHRSNWSIVVDSGLPFHLVVTSRNTTNLSNPTRYRAKPSWREY